MTGSHIAVDRWSNASFRYNVSSSNAMRDCWWFMVVRFVVVLCFVLGFGGQMNHQKRKDRYVRVPRFPPFPKNSFI